MNRIIGSLKWNIQEVGEELAKMKVSFSRGETLKRE